MNAADGPRTPVTIAVSSSSGLRDRLAGLLKDVSIDVDSPTLDDDVRRIVREGTGRVLLIDHTELPEDAVGFLERTLTDDDSPSLVIVSDDIDDVERAQMLAAGASHVVDVSVTDERLRERLGAIAETEAQGGVDGPEIRGNEAQPTLADFLSRSHSMRRFVRTVEKAADVDCSLLITGETGVGKERLARAVHAASGRPGPFVGLNCGALPESLLESQLFGHEKGAFTGANASHKGFFEQAVGGTLFLDEIGEVPQHLQVKLLTVLQRHEVHPLGAEAPVPVDVRVIAATNRDLKAEIREERFREDLFYRLNVIHLQIPPLRNRVEDIPDLVGGLIQFFRGDLVKTSVQNISGEALDALSSYRWPGNIRELINVIERAMILSEGPLLGLRDLPREIANPAPTNESGVVDDGADGSPAEASSSTAWLPPDWREKSLKEVREAAAAQAERAFLDRALRECDGKLVDVARLARIGNRSLYDKMRKYGLEKEAYR